LIHPQFDPIAIRLGSFGIHWYGLMYLAAFLAFLWLGNRQLKLNRFHNTWTRDDVDAILFAGVLGVILGGRLGYVIFYKPTYYLANPLEAFAIWKGGMSFHGGLIGVIVAEIWYSWRSKKPLLEVADFVAPLVPPGLMFGRIGNFINGELWGRPTEGPWAMIFPQAGDRIARHPSQIYQALLEGLLLFIVLWWYARTPHAQARPGRVAGLFLVGYGLARFIVEFAREPDNYLGLLALGLSMGQWLSLPMIIFGVWLLFRPKI
jgi:phosphatidylglycerol---prolipoprotein diacylglyceryl transferase